MKQKNHKDFFVYEKIAFDLIAVDSPHYKEHTSDWQLMF